MTIKKVPDGIVVRDTANGYTFKLSSEDCDYLRRSGRLKWFTYQEDTGEVSRKLAVNGNTNDYEFFVERHGRVDSYLLTFSEYHEIIGLLSQNEQMRRTA